MNKLFLVLLALLPVALCAQITKQPSLKISYWTPGLAQPGLGATYELPFRYKEKTVNWKDTTRSVYHIKSIGFKTALYRHAGHHIGFILQPQYRTKRIFKEKKIQGWAYGLGYHRSFLDADTYRQASDGTFEKIPLAGQNSFFLSGAHVMGRDLRNTKNVPLSWEIEIGAFLRFPYNSLLTGGLTLDLGVHYFLDGKSDSATSKNKR